MRSERPRVGLSSDEAIWDVLNSHKNFKIIK